MRQSLSWETFFWTTKIGILLTQVNITNSQKKKKKVNITRPTSQRKQRLTYWLGMGMHGMAFDQTCETMHTTK